MKLGLAEILENASNLDQESQVLYLRKNDSQPLRQILKFAFDKGIEWELPPGAPPYTPCRYLDQENMLYTEMKRMYLFLKGGNPNLKPRRREELFIGLLESIMPKDAELLCAVKDHNMPYNISEKVVREAFPDLLLFPYEEKMDTSQVKILQPSKKKDLSFAERMKIAKAKKKLEKEKVISNE